ncbi:MAG: hypothetical protein DMF61_03140 [Blastocatellia bacterium AA13]|nr:MAG: hypothetical protein DMF61_03140 [Blastocatellia bacterium AA13]
MNKGRVTSPPISRSVAARLALGLAALALLLLPAATGIRRSALPGATAAEAAVAPVASCPLATVCLTDERTGDHLSYTCPAGTYTYKRCSTGFTLTGTGVVNTVNGVETLTDAKPDRRINAGLLTGTGTGKAVIYVIVAPGIIQTLTIDQTTPFKACGTC